jgi:hypothetical protein
VVQTKLSLASGVMSVVAIAGAVLVSFTEDQRSSKPSSLLVLYFSALSITYLPRLRSLWLSHSVGLPRSLWTVVYILTMLTMLLEPSRKVKFLRLMYKTAMTEEISGFWGRALLVWLIPTLRRGYSNVFHVGEIPEVDKSLGGSLPRAKLQAAWESSMPRYRLLKALFYAYLQPILACVLPRLILDEFTLCQSFLITAAIHLFVKGCSHERDQYGKPLIGAFVLVYLGMAVSRISHLGPSRLVNSRGLTNLVLGIKSRILASGKSGCSHGTNWPHFRNLPPHHSVV